MRKRDGRVGGDGEIGGIKITVTTVTIDTGSESLARVQGGLFKGQPCWGVVRRQRGKAQQPPRGRFPHGVGEMSRRNKAGVGPVGPQQHLLMAAG
jgi:hypothetical protein